MSGSRTSPPCLSFGCCLSDAHLCKDSRCSDLLPSKAFQQAVYFSMHAGFKGRCPVNASRHIRRCPTWERAPALATCSYAARRSRARQGGNRAAGVPVAPGAEAGARQSEVRCLVGGPGRAAARRGQTPWGAGRACRRGTAVTACTTCSTLLLPETNHVQAATGRACNADQDVASTPAARRGGVIELHGHWAGPAARCTP